ncbi:MAG: hypothetical protein AAGA54_28125 [Myxococcota bacterium]
MRFGTPTQDAHLADEALLMVRWHEDDYVWSANASGPRGVATMRVQADPWAEDPMGGVYAWEVTLGGTSRAGVAYTPKQARGQAEAAANRLLTPPPAVRSNAPWLVAALGVALATVWWATQG